jgi:methylmalonyl-CoA mutase
MSSPVLSFPAAGRRQWQDIVAKALKGASVESLNRTDEDGLDIAALYQVEPTAVTKSGQVPVHRLTANPAQRLAYGWRVCQPVDGGGKADEVNDKILNELTGGATGVYLSLGPVSAPDLEQMLHDVVLGAADIIIDAGLHIGSVMAAFESLSYGQNKSLSDIGLDLAIDPFAPQSDASLLEDGLRVLCRTDERQIPHGVFRLNGWQWHNQGMSQVQEIGYLLAAATQIFRSGMAAGLSAAQIAPKTSMCLALPADLFDGIAKCRAIRRGWSGLVTALGLDANSYRLKLQTLPSLRMFSLIDADMNMLRTTTALLGGAIGGTDIMTAFAHDELSGASPMGRRLARMQQIMMIEESGLGRSLDAAGGSAFIEARSDALAESAWAAFQDIEASGGAAVAQSAQQFAAMAEAAATKRKKEFAAGALPMLGVTLQSDGQPVVDLMPRWQAVSRPASVIEALRRQTALNPPRILILQPGSADNLKLQAVRRVLQIGGMSAVHFTLPLDQPDAMTTARPEIVVLIDMEIDSLAPAIQTQLNQSLLADGIFAADDILKSEAQIAWLIKLADMTKEPN